MEGGMCGEERNQEITQAEVVLREVGWWGEGMRRRRTRKSWNSVCPDKFFFCFNVSTLWQKIKKKEEKKSSVKVTGNSASSSFYKVI